MQFSLQQKQIALYFAIILNLGLAIGIFGPTVHELARNTNTDVPTLGFLLTARGFGGLATGFISGYLMEKFSGHKRLVFFLLGMLVSVVLTPLVTSFTALIVASVLMGMSVGAAITISNGLCIWACPTNTAMVLNIVHGAFGIGNFLSPILALIADSAETNYNGPYFFIAGCIGVLCIALLFVPSPSCPAMDSQRKDLLRASLVSSSLPTQNAPDTRVVIKPTLLLLSLICCAIIFTIGPVGCRTYSTFGSLLNMYAVDIDMSQSDGKLMTTAYWVAFTGGRFAVAGFLTLYSINLVQSGELLLCLVSGLGMLIFPTNPTILWVISITYGLGISGVYGNLLALASSRFVITGRLNGIFSTAFSAADVLTPAIITFLMGKDNSRFGSIAFIYTIGIMTLLLIGFSVWNDHASAKELQKQQRKQPVADSNALELRIGESN